MSSLGEPTSVNLFHAGFPKRLPADNVFVETFCWTGITYHVDNAESLDSKNVTIVHYYLWVPIILLFQAFMFKVPNIIWHMTNKGSGMNLEKISNLSEKTQTESENTRMETIEHIGNYIERWIMANKMKNSNFIYRFRPKPGTYLTTVFFLIKLLYCINVISQFYVVSSLMKINFAEYGLKVTSYLEQNAVMMDPTVFPRVVYCDFSVRQMHNVMNLTAQCVLPINVLNEKVFMFLWFWFCLVSTLSIINLLHWIYRILSKESYVDYIFRYINVSEETLDRADRKACVKFVDRFLSMDVVMLLRVVGKNSTDLVVADLLGYLWTMYKKKRQNEENKMIDAWLKISFYWSHLKNCDQGKQTSRSFKTHNNLLLIKHIYARIYTHAQTEILFIDWSIW